MWNRHNYPIFSCCNNIPLGNNSIKKRKSIKNPSSGNEFSFSRARTGHKTKKKKDPGRPSNTNTENPPKQNNKQTVREITHHANDILTQKIGLFIHHLNKQEPKLNYLKTSVKLCRLHLRIQNFGYALCWSYVYSNISKQVSEVYT